MSSHPWFGDKTSKWLEEQARKLGADLAAVYARRPLAPDARQAILAKVASGEPPDWRDPVRADSSSVCGGPRRRRVGW